MEFLTHSPFDATAVASSLWLLLALPFLGALICGVFGKALGRQNTQLIACATVAGAFLYSLIVLWTTNETGAAVASPFTSLRIPYAIGHDYGVWFSAGDFVVRLGLRADHLTVAMLLVITGVGFLIHVYSTGYMEHDEGYARYFAYLNLFIGMMLTLVLADNLLLLFVGWEGVGLCSYLLIGFWYTDTAKAWAGRKAFVVNRIGDFGFLIGSFLLVLLVSAFNNQAGSENFAAGGNLAWKSGLIRQGPFDFQGLEEMSKLLPPKAEPSLVGAVTLQTPINSGPLKGRTMGAVLTAVLLLFLVGAAGKSAQLPLYVWLPDAMAGPTPVSALIHAATMVTAGVYLFCRLNFLLLLSPTAMAAVGLVGAFTALLAAVIALAQNDIKKILAYSTISQLGIMFIGVGVGAFWAAMFHLVTHAFFKACLFLGAGSVMHGNGDETDIHRLGGLRREMPWTWRCFLVATVAITGVIPLSGFFSKDAILHVAHATTIRGHEAVGRAVWVIGLLVAVGTAFYMARLYILTFEGNRSPQAKVKRAHESPFSMVFPLVALAVLSFVGGAYALPVGEHAALIVFLLLAAAGVLFWARSIPAPVPMAVGAIIVLGSIAFSVPREGHQAVIQNYLLSSLLTSEKLRLTYPLVLTHESSVWGAYGLALLLAWIGAGAAGYFYLRWLPASVGRPIPPWVRRLRTLVESKFYVDELYDFLVVRPVKFISMIFYRLVDEFLIDTVLVRGTAWLTQTAGSALRYLQTGNAQSYAVIMALGVLAVAAFTLLRVAP